MVVEVKSAFGIVGHLDQVFDHVNQGRTFALQIGGKQSQNHVILDIAVELGKSFSITFFIQGNVGDEMLAGCHSGRAATGEGFFGYIGIRNHLVAFEKLYRQKGDLLQRFYFLDIGLQKIAKFSIDQIVFILEAKSFQGNFFKLLLARNGKYVVSWNQE